VLTAGWIGVGIALYPLLFVPGLQSAVGWFLNDVVLGLLGLAEYLCVRRLRVA
jgi:hypothetical protein